jgi:hypothetical protein
MGKKKVSSLKRGYSKNKVSKMHAGGKKSLSEKAGEKEKIIRQKVREFK